jgi:hypothetical protein
VDKRGRLFYVTGEAERDSLLETEAKREREREREGEREAETAGGRDGRRGGRRRHAPPVRHHRLQEEVAQLQGARVARRHR